MRWPGRVFLAAFKVDERCRVAVSAAYTRLWNETGVYLGTVRFVLLMGSVVPYGIGATLDSPTPWAVSLVLGAVFILALSIIPFLHGYKAHLVEERTLQRLGKLDFLNSRSMSWALGRSLMMRMFTLGIFFAIRPALAAFGNGDQSWLWDPSLYVCYASWWLYGLTLGVMVLPRKKPVRQPREARNHGLEPLPA